MHSIFDFFAWRYYKTHATNGTEKFSDNKPVSLFIHVIDTNDVFLPLHPNKQSIGQSNHQ